MPTKIFLLGEHLTPAADEKADQTDYRQRALLRPAPQPSTSRRSARQ
jgi:hypothetical protein